MENKRFLTVQDVVEMLEVSLSYINFWPSGLEVDNYGLTESNPVEKSWLLW